MRTSIKLWLNNPNRTYQDGLAMLEELKHPQRDFFRAAKNPDRESYHFRMMISMLQNSLRILNQTPAPKVKDAPSVQVLNLSGRIKEKIQPKKAATLPPQTNDGAFRIADLDLIDIRELPNNLSNDYKRIKLLMPDIARKHAEMKAAKDNEARKQLLDEIQKMETERLELWKGINEWYRVNVTEKPKQAEPDQERIAREASERAIARVRRMEAVKINIARARKEIDSGKLTTAKIKSREDKIVAWEKELEDLENE